MTSVVRDLGCICRSYHPRFQTRVKPQDEEVEKKWKRRSPVKAEAVAPALSTQSSTSSVKVYGGDIADAQRELDEIWNVRALRS